MFCLDCHHRLTGTIEDGLLVKRSSLNDSRTCETTGRDHRSGDAIDYAQEVSRTIPAVLKMVDDGDLTAAQGLEVIAIDLGFKERSEGSKRISAFLKAVEEGIVPAEAIEHVLAKP
jgi:hypothetical protein